MPLKLPTVLKNVLWGKESNNNYSGRQVHTPPLHQPHLDRAATEPPSPTTTPQGNQISTRAPTVAPAEQQVWDHCRGPPELSVENGCTTSSLVVDKGLTRAGVDVSLEADEVPDREDSRAENMQNSSLIHEQPHTSSLTVKKESPVKNQDNLTQAAEYDDVDRIVSEMQQLSVPTSDYDTMTTMSSLTSNAQDFRASDSENVQNPSPTSSPRSPRSPNHVHHSSSTDSLDSFEFGSHTGYPTVIHVDTKIPSSSARSRTAENKTAGHGRADNKSRQSSPPNGVRSTTPNSSESTQHPSPSKNAPVRNCSDQPQASANQTVAVACRRKSGQSSPRGMGSGHWPQMPEDLDQELFPESALSIPIGALRKSRKRLSLLLNIEMPVQESGRTSDFRGLADMLGFDTVQIENFWERNPSDTLFMEWIRCRDSSLLPAVFRTLVDCLERLERRDILEDCRGLILEDVRDFLAEQQLLSHYAVQRLERFDCYVNIADQDILTVGREILDTLEGVYGLRLCLTLRDVTLGDCLYESMAEMLETRCNSKVLLVLTKNYEGSEACQFLTQYAVTLDPCSREKKLIPLLVDEDAYIPRTLRFLARLNYHQARALGLLWPRLMKAIRI